MPNKLSAYLTAILIALAGLGFLLGVIYYILYLPLPAPLISLKHRIITTLQLEEKVPIYVFLRGDVEQIVVYETPDLDSEQITVLPPGGSYRLLRKEEEWCKIRITADVQGWIEREFIVNH